MLRVLLLLVCSLAPGAAFAKANGVDSRASFPPLGCGSAADPDGDGVTVGEELGCHFQDASPQLLVTIDGPSQIDVGSQAAGFYTASIPQDFMALKGAGINVALDAPNAPGCELEAFGPVGKLGFQNDSLSDGPVLSHFYEGDPPPSTLVGVWSYQFLVLNCKTPGALLLRVAMNAFDGNGAEDGEVWNGTSLGVTVPEPRAALLGLVAVAGLAAISRERAHG